MDDFQKKNNSSGLSDLNSNISHDGDNLINSTERSLKSFNRNSSSPDDQNRTYSTVLKATIDEYPASTSSDNSNDSNESLSFVSNSTNPNLYYSNQYLSGSLDVNTYQNNTYANLLNYSYSMPQYFQNITHNPHFNYYNSILPPQNSYSNPNTSDNSLNGFNKIFPNLKNEQTLHEQDNTQDAQQINNLRKVNEEQNEQYQEEIEENSENNSFSSTRKPPSKIVERELEVNNSNNQSYLMQPPDSELIAAATLNVRTKRRTRTKFDQHQLDALEATFQRTHYPDVHVVDRLATLLKLTPEKISIWFQNRRAKFKKSKKSSTTDQRIEEEKELNLSKVIESNEITLDSIGKKTSELCPFKERNLNEIENIKQKTSKTQDTKQHNFESVHVSKGIFNPVNLPSVNQTMFTKPFQLHYQTNSNNLASQHGSYQIEENMKLPLTAQENSYTTSTPAPKDSSVTSNNSTNGMQSPASKDSSSPSSTSSSYTSASCLSSYDVKHDQVNQEETYSSTAYLQTSNLFFNHQYQPSSKSFYTYPLQQYANFASIPQIFQPYIDYNLQDSNTSNAGISMQTCLYNNYSNYLSPISVNDPTTPYKSN